MNKVAYFYDDAFMKHQSGKIIVQGSKGKLTCGNEYDTPQIISNIHNVLEISGMLQHLQRLPLFSAPDETLALVHSTNYIREFKSQCKKAGDQLVTFGKDRSTGGANTEALASLGAGGACHALNAIMSQEADHAYVLARPTGRLAGVGYAMGYCFYNHAAIAASYAQSAYNLERIAIINWGSMHANGTQEIFYQDDHVLTISIHEEHNYPLETGATNEIGIAGAEGKNINIPLPAGSGFNAYNMAFERIVFPTLNEFAPDLIILSAGQDASLYDALGNMRLNRNAFYRLSKNLSVYAKQYCSGRLIAIHEGGFSNHYTPISTLGVIEGLFGQKTSLVDEFDVDDLPIRPIERLAIDDAIKTQAPYWLALDRRR